MGPKGKEQLGEANGHKGNGQLQGAQGSLSASLNSVRALSRACQSLHRAMGAKEAPSTALRRAKGRVITRKLRARSKKGVHASNQGRNSKAPPPSRKCRAFDFKGSNRGWNAMATCEAMKGDGTATGDMNKRYPKLDYCNHQGKYRMRSTWPSPI